MRTIKDKIEKLEEHILECDIKASSEILSELYNEWDTLDKNCKKNITSIEPIYMTMARQYSIAINGDQYE